MLLFLVSQLTTLFRKLLFVVSQLALSVGFGLNVLMTLLTRLSKKLKLKGKLYFTVFAMGSIEGRREQQGFFNKLHVRLSLSHISTPPLITDPS